MESEKKEVKKVIQIIECLTGKVVKEIDVTGKSERLTEKLEDGVNINLNTELFYTLIADK